MILICQDVHSARRYVDVIHQSLRFGIWNMFILSGHHPVNHCSLLDSWISLSRFGNHASFLYPFMIFYEWHIHSSSSCLCFFSTHLYFFDYPIITLGNVCCYLMISLVLLKQRFKRLTSLHLENCLFGFFWTCQVFTHSWDPKSWKELGRGIPSQDLLLKGWNPYKSQNWKGKSSSKPSIVRFHRDFFQGVF